MAALGYVLPVVLVAISAVCALGPPRGSGRTATVAYVVGFAAAQVPTLLGFWLLLNTAITWALGDLWSIWGLAGLGLTMLTLAGLGLLVARMQATRRVLDSALQRDLVGIEATPAVPGLADPSPRPMSLTRSLWLPFLRRRRDVEHLTDLAYGPAGRFHRLDLYRHRSHRGDAPVFVHFHGGRFVSGAKDRESLPMLYYLAASGWIVLSANYRLSPGASFPDAHTDAKRVLAWARENVQEYGGDGTRIVIAGNSAGAHLALFAALTPNDPRYQPDFPHADTSVSAAIGLSGYYGPLDGQRPQTSPAAHLHSDAPPTLLLHGDRDSVVPTAWASTFATFLRTASRQPVVYAQLPGAQHNLDYFPSIRTSAVIDCVDVFTRWALVSSTRSSPGQGTSGRRP